MSVSKRPRLVGAYIRKRREVLGLSQRALGLRFMPAVTTQFISNVERGVTPLPPVHVSTLAKALSVEESELMGLLEKEYSAKLTERLGHFESSISRECASSVIPGLTIKPADEGFMRDLYRAYQAADPRTRQTFDTICHTILNVSKTPSSA